MEYYTRYTIRDIANQIIFVSQRHLIRSFARFSRPPMHVHHVDPKTSEPSADRIISRTPYSTDCHSPLAVLLCFILHPTSYIPLPTYDIEMWGCSPRGFPETRYHMTGSQPLPKMEHASSHTIGPASDPDETAQLPVPEIRHSKVQGRGPRGFDNTLECIFISQ